MKVYRDWLLSGDDELAAPPLAAREAGPRVRLEVRGTPTATASWRASSTTPTTSSSAGPNTMCGSLYLGALRAAEEMARHLGDDEAAAEYRTLFESGRAGPTPTLQRRVLRARRSTRPTSSGPCHRDSAPTRQDDTFRGQVPVRRGLPLRPAASASGSPTSSAWATSSTADHVRAACASIFRHNWRADLCATTPTRSASTPLNDEAGLLLCTWPRGGGPSLPLPLLRRGLVGHRVPGGRPPDLRGPRRRGPGHRQGRARPPRRRCAATPGTSSSAATTTPAPWRPGPCSWPSPASTTTPPARRLRFATPRPPNRVLHVLLHGDRLGDVQAGCPRCRPFRRPPSQALPRADLRSGNPRRVSRRLAVKTLLIEPPLRGRTIPPVTALLGDRSIGCRAAWTAAPLPAGSGATRAVRTPKALAGCLRGGDGDSLPGSLPGPLHSVAEDMPVPENSAGGTLPPLL